MISPSEALRRFEQKLIPVRTVAGNNDAWTVYAREMLPGDGIGEVLIHQGFDAGYDAAMAQVRRILNEVQSESLREQPIQRIEVVDVNNLPGPVADGTVGMRRGE